MSRTLQLSTVGREYWTVYVKTDPPTTGWEASFDHGTTWVAGETVPGQDDTYRWLVRGPNFPTTGVPTAASNLVPTDNFTPVLRSIDDPEVVVVTGPKINLLPA